MYNGLNGIFLGSIALIFKINLGSIPVLPASVAWHVIFLGISEVARESNNSNFVLAKKVALFMVIKNIITGYLAFSKTPILETLPYIYISYLEIMVILIAYYLILEGAKEIIMPLDPNFGYQINDATKKIIIQNVIITLFLILSTLFNKLGFVLVGAIALFISRLYTIYWVREIRNQFKDKALQNPDES